VPFPVVVWLSWLGQSWSVQVRWGMAVNGAEFLVAVSCVVSSHGQAVMGRIG